MLPCAYNQFDMVPKKGHESKQYMFLDMPSVHHPPCVDAGICRRSPYGLCSGSVSRHGAHRELEYHSGRLSTGYYLWG